MRHGSLPTRIDLDDLVLARIDHADDAEVAVRGVEKACRRCDGAAMLMPLISPRYLSGSSLATPGHVGDLDLLQQLVAPHVDDADPVRAVVADVGLGAVRQ